MERNCLKKGYKYVQYDTQDPPPPHQKKTKEIPILHQNMNTAYIYGSVQS